MRNLILILLLSLLPPAAFAQTCGGPVDSSSLPAGSVMIGGTSNCKTSIVSVGSGLSLSGTFPNFTLSSTGSPPVGPSGAIQFNSGGILGGSGNATVDSNGNMRLGGGINGWPVQLGVLANSNPTPSNEGTGYNVGDAVTLNDGCSTHAVVAVVLTASGPPGPVTGYNVTNPGLCTNAPSNPVGQLSTTGTGTGLQLTLQWAPVGVAGLRFGGLALGDNGNMFLAAESPAPQFAGQETTIVGDKAFSPVVGYATQNTIIGHNAAGNHGNCTVTAPSGITAIGTDALTYWCGGSSITAIGNTALKFYNGTTATQVVAVGNGAMAYEAPGQNSYSTAVGYQAGLGYNPGGNATGADYYHGSFFGAQTGGAITTGHDVTFIGYNVGNTTFATGSDVTLIDSGANALDAAAAATHYLNVNNAFRARTTAPTVASGFGTSPAIAAGVSSAAFEVNVGTGGSASSGVISFGLAMATGYACHATDNSNPASFVEAVTIASASTVTVTNYSRTTGLAIAWTASDLLTMTCNGF